MTDMLATTIAWERLTGPQEAFAPAWAHRRAAVTAAIPSITDMALFRVLEGTGSFVAVYGAAAVDGTEVAQALSADEWYEATGSREGPVRIYHQVFAASDARRFADVTGYVFAVNADIDPPDPREFEHWYNDVHVPDVGAAGLRRPRRFHAEGAAWKYFATYEITSPEVMGSAELQRVRGFHQYTPYLRAIDRLILEIFMR
jgi:hypothetical protein